ncbi:hypothetical protein COO60DRAFT_903131 [Scenedesmus sp. NREL 46B-D3]|nr:hypothetical protein COO60DRAFT_903131 [Scenedesmus sp. NREL 46B-D3]
MPERRQTIDNGLMAYGTSFMPPNVLTHLAVSHLSLCCSCAAGCSMLQLFHPTERHSTYSKYITFQTQALLMSLKRKASTTLPQQDQEHPAKKAALHGHTQHNAVLMPWSSGCSMPGPVIQQQAACLSVSGLGMQHQQQQQQQQQQQHRQEDAQGFICQATSSASGYRPEDMQMVLYQPPPQFKLAESAAAAAAMVNNNLYLPQQRVQQPTAVATLWRSLTPHQRRSLAGMWDALRDQRVLAGMLRKLPVKDGPAAAAEDAAAYSAEQQQGACVIEELGEGDEGQGQLVPAAVAAAVEPLGGWLQQQQQVVPVACAAAAAAAAAASAGDSMIVDAGCQALGAQQEQQQDEGCGMDLD